MPNDSPDNSPVRYSYSTNSEQDLEDPDFPPIRIGNDPPLCLRPLLPPPHPNRYRLNPAPDHKMQEAINPKMRRQFNMTVTNNDVQNIIYKEDFIYNNFKLPIINITRL